MKDEKKVSSETRSKNNKLMYLGDISTDHKREMQRSHKAKVFFKQNYYRETR